MPKYCLCGLRIASDFPLGGASLVEDEAGADAAGSHADIRIVAGSVPDRLEGARGTRFQVAPDGAVRVNIRDVGAFLVEGGRHVTVAAAPGVSEPKLALFLLGTVFGFLCHQRGLFPLHASTIEIGGRAFSFAGDSGAGKSTTAAALIELGHTLLSDDISVIDLSGAQPMILPANPT
ncbi:hypothetical protein AB5I39_10505 [Sphingomonas sp. MMS24-J45]|uniref:hypothetical protein n=1 Tax=Sphingomonas sp. MMS24-J45 TaxID=3238806 RepID=UPI00384CC879